MATNWSGRVSQTNIPVGGTAITAGGLEFRQRFYPAGRVAFVDRGAGQPQPEAAAFGCRVGAGAGMRYYTPIGPIRFDIAVPVGRRPAKILSRST